MKAKAASAIRFAIALAVKEHWVYRTTKRHPMTAYTLSMLDSERWITQFVPRRYQKLALRALTRSRTRQWKRYLDNLLTGAKQAYYDVYNEHYDREN